MQKAINYVFQNTIFIAYLNGNAHEKQYCRCVKHTNKKKIIITQTKTHWPYPVVKYCIAWNVMARLNALSHNTPFNGVPTKLYN